MQDDDDDTSDLWMEPEAAEGLARWLPRIIVTITIAGFVALALYAYRTGTQSLKDEDLMVVEADKTPIKEKPEDPGGMKFPNQDKTVFETFAGNTAPPKVERVMPPPEEPMSKVDTSDTKTWINEDLQQKQTGKPEQIIGGNTAAAVAPVPKKELVVAPQKVEEAQSALNLPENNIVSYTMDKALATKEKIEAPVVAAPKAIEAPKTETKNTSAKTASGKDNKVQLGAYGSDKEAREAYSKLEKKFPILSNKKPIVVKADLGKKGIFYRLRVGGFATVDDAREFCKALTVKKQACIPAL
jgi:hypothetical protein